ncbi:MAG: beta-ketoacyl synthase chain length factor [Desulfobacterales bacterium]|nr:beta-ketoacyl synthase chain length factor [Desulfobacterales bacterium]
MTIRVYIAGTGTVCALGIDLAETEAALRENRSAIRPLTRFQSAHDPPLPVGEVDLAPETGGPGRTHRLARMAADQAMARASHPPDAIVIGVTTGGMPETESLLKQNIEDPNRFRHHGTGSVAEDLADRLGCTGPALSISTACSSSAVAIKIAADMIRSGRFKRVLAGGADGLCRLTYYGFHALQLIDPDGARPFDRGRRGMSVAEGAAMLLLCANPGQSAGIEILGAGLSCDAHHPAAPHPEGKGAWLAMTAALSDAGIPKQSVDYINLHGTGTPDNDRSEARALARLYPEGVPAASSIKGATGHTLAAAGAIEAVIAARCIDRGLIPANTRLLIPDPQLGLVPVSCPETAPVSTVLSNSFGFGGNNAALVIGAGRNRESAERPGRPTPPPPMRIMGSACITGAGFTEQTLSQWSEAGSCSGALPLAQISEGLLPRLIRRLKRLPRMSLALAVAAHAHAGGVDPPEAVFFGTGWGALSETHDFLTGLFESDDKFTSPTDFIGSVHNAPAGQIALYFGANGANVTASGGDYSFEQALVCADLAATGPAPFLVLGADEFHPALSPRFDPSVGKTEPFSDGGGAMVLSRDKESDGPAIAPVLFENGRNHPLGLSALVRRLTAEAGVNDHYGAVFVGIPAAARAAGEEQLAGFLKQTGFSGPVVDYRKWTGEFAAASAVAAVLAARYVAAGRVPAAMTGKAPVALDRRGILVLGLGSWVTAVEVMPS